MISSKGLLCYIILVIIQSAKSVYRIVSSDVEQSVKATFSPMDMPSTICVNKNQPFVLNPGRWRIHIRTKQRLFLVRLPLFKYYKGS